MTQPNSPMDSLARACAMHMQSADRTELNRAFAPPRPDAPGDDPTPGQFQIVFDTATRLCEEGNFRFATALALHLATYRPKEPRYCALAGKCLQHLGAYANAARFYGYALMNGGDNPAVLFRLGECLLALGDKANAEIALDTAFEVAREIEGAAPLQTAARDLLDSIGKSSVKHPQPGAGAPGEQR